ncbi:MAG: glycosyltransferase [Sphingobacteriales bacterium]|nr:glycosyltransferase [Sphingobacteriales bacterium]
MNILIHAPTSKEGGGKYIIENVFKNIAYEISTNFFAIIPSKLIKIIPDTHVNIIKIPSVYEKWWSAPIYYNLILKRIIKKYKIDCIWNFGDVIVPCFYNQLYYFDWAFLVYDESYLWKNVSSKIRFKRKIKIRQIEKNIKEIRYCIVQTDNMFVRLSDKYKVNNIIKIPTPVLLPEYNFRIQLKLLLESSGIKFLFISTFASHKNHFILLKLASLIKNQNLSYKIFLTLDSNDAASFLDEIKLGGLSDVIINLGVLERGEVASAIKQCDYLIIPSLLESYGIVFYEGMKFEKLILTSDMDFARDACGESALYFDPFVEDSIMDKMKEAVNLPEAVKKYMLVQGLKRLKSIPDWPQFINEFINITQIND